MDQREENFSSSVTDAMLHAYVDGQLDSLAKKRVRKYLQENPNAAARIWEYASQKLILHELFDRHLDSEIPHQSRQLIRHLERRIFYSRWSRVGTRVAALAAVVMVFFVAIGQLTNQPFVFQQSKDQLFSLFRDSVSSEKPNPAKAEVKQVAMTKAVSNIASSSPEEPLRTASPKITLAPDLSKFGFRLIGTRLLAASKKRAMQLVYEGNDGSQVTLYFSPAPSENKTLTLMQQGPLALLYWSNNSRLYTMLGEVDRATLLEMGQTVNDAWTLKADVPDLNNPQKKPDKLEVKSKNDTKSRT